MTAVAEKVNRIKYYLSHIVAFNKQCIKIIWVGEHYVKYIFIDGSYKEFRFYADGSVLTYMSKA